LQWLTMTTINEKASQALALQSILPDGQCYD
jgi:hypothetical protein